MRSPFFTRERGYVLAVLIFQLLAALWFSRPLVLHLTDAITYGTTPDVDLRREGRLPVRPSDMHQVLFHQWLFFDNITHGRNPLANVYEFGPLNVRKLHWLGVWGFPMHLVFFLPAFFSPVLALNLMLLATFPITGFIQYKLLRQCGVRPLFAFLGASLFGFALGRRVQMFCGHMNGALYFTLALTALTYLLAIRRRSWPWAWVCGGSVMLWALGEWHMYYFSALYLPFIVTPLLVSELGPRGGRMLALRRFIELSLPALLGLALGGAYLLWYRSQFIVGSTAANRGWVDMASNSHVPDNLWSAKRHLTGPVVFGAEVESAFALGVANLVAIALLLLLALVVGIAARKRARAAIELLQTSWLCSALLAAPLFALLSTGSHGDEAVGLYSVLFRTLPHFNIIRVPGRMIYLVYFSLAMCLPLLLERMHRQVAFLSKAAGRILGACSLILVLCLACEPVFSAPGAALSGVLDREALAPLKKVIRQSEPVLLLPVTGTGTSMGSLAEHLIVGIRRPTLNGYAPNAPRAASDVLGRISTMNRGKLSAEAHRELWDLGVRHVLQLHHVEFLRPVNTKSRYLRSLQRREVLESIDNTDDYHLFALLPPR